MTIIGLILSWIFSLLLGVLTLSMFLTRNYKRGAILLAAALLLLPPIQTLIKNQTGNMISPLISAIGAIALVGIFGWSMSREEKTSIYFTPGARARMMEIYDSKLAQWPTPFESRFVDTSYGKIHVIISGPEDGPAVLLLNAGQMAGWSWMTNAGALNEQYRTYAIDTIGEPGRSELKDIRRFPQNGKDLSELLLEITDALGIEKSCVVGASNGGFMAANYAIYHPERIEKMALLGPMGLTPSTNENIVRITLAQLFPLRPIQNSTLHWAFGKDPELMAQIEDWFRLVMNGTAPQQTPPKTMAAEELQKVGVPTLLVIGTQDNLMGDLAAVKELASNLPGIEIKEIEAGHLMGMEKPEVCNKLILDFFKNSIPELEKEVDHTTSLD